MGMAIKEAVPILHDMYNYYNDTDVDAYIDFDKEDNNAIETVLDTMRKYQKITEIVEEWDKDLIDYEGHYGDDYMEKIQEVLKDGKID